MKQTSRGPYTYDQLPRISAYVREYGVVNELSRAQTGSTGVDIRARLACCMFQNTHPNASIVKCF